LKALNPHLKYSLSIPPNLYVEDGGSSTSHINIPHTHNQQKQHTCEGKTHHTTTKQKKKQSPNQKNNPNNNQKGVAQQTPTTTKRVLRISNC
jgi:hypothetical protein